MRPTVFPFRIKFFVLDPQSVFLTLLCLVSTSAVINTFIKLIGRAGSVSTRNAFNISPLPYSYQSL
jgi:hypothetical protein